MRYVAARRDQERCDRAYRFYVTDALKAIGNLNLRYADIIKTDAVEDANPDEIISRIRGKLKRLGKEPE